MTIKSVAAAFIYTFILLSANAKAEAILHDMNDNYIPFSSLSGKWIFINYWASWCQPCLDEIPELNYFYEQNKTNNVAVFAVNYDAQPLAAQKTLIKTFDIHYPALQTDPANHLHLGAIDAVPVTFVFNPQGQLIEKLYGGQTVKSLNKILASK